MTPRSTRSATSDRPALSPLVGARGLPLPDALIARLERIVQSIGEARAIRELKIPRNTLARGLARLPVQRGTEFVIEHAVSDYERRPAP